MGSLEKGHTFIAGKALLVAIANYQRVSKLPSSCLNDARDLAEVLANPALCGFDPKNVRVLLDSDATLANIRDALQSLCADSQPDDAVLIYFSGHGGIVGPPDARVTVLAPVDADMSSPMNTTLQEAELSQAVHGLKAKKVVVMLDACHSGSAVRLKSIGEPPDIEFGYLEKSLDRLKSGTGRVVIASSRSTETSLILPGARNSLFTEHVIDALKGAAPSSIPGVVRILELFSFVSDNVKMRSAGAQTPILKASDVDENFAIALRSGRGSKGDIAIDTPTRSNDDWENLRSVMVSLYPLGPADQNIWERAGGDSAQLRHAGSGAANWFAALKVLRQGGGGTLISYLSLVQAARADFPNNESLRRT